MGIDYYSCKRCGESFPDVIDYVSCSCGEHWCSIECADLDGFEYGWITDEDGDEVEDYDSSSCKYCRKEDVEDYALLSTALKLLGLTRDDLVKKHFESK